MNNELLNRLNSCSTRQEGSDLLSKLTKKELLKFAYQSEIYVKSSLDKNMIIDRLVCSTVGITIMNTILKGE